MSYPYYIVDAFAEEVFKRQSRRCLCFGKMVARSGDAKHCD